MLNNFRIIMSDDKMSDVILNNHFQILMMEHFGIGLVVGEKSVEEICIENHIGTELFLVFANLFNGNRYLPINEFTPDDIKVIISYLRRSHQYYEEEKLPKIHKIILSMKSSNHGPEMQMVDNFYQEYVKEVKEHLDYENDIVFPYVNNLIIACEGSFEKSVIKNYSVFDYKEHHNDIEEKLNDLKSLLIKYLPQDEDQIIRRKLLFSLFEFEFDLRIHSKIEDTILIPVVEKMELRLKKGNN